MLRKPVNILGKVMNEKSLNLVVDWRYTTLPVDKKHNASNLFWKGIK